MGFHLYFAGSQQKGVDEYMQEKNVFRLFSQTNEWKPILDWSSKGHNNLFIDSGAFSVAHKGIDVDIDEYITKINENPQIPIWAELDVIPYPNLSSTSAKISSDKSWKNYVYMKERLTADVTLLPLYHFGEPKDGLRRILNTPVNGELAPYIGVGGRHGVTTDLQKKYFKEVFSIIQNSDNPNVKVHAFGITVFDLLENFPFYSADSTSWLKFAVYGMIITRLGQVVISERSQAKQENFKWFPKEAQEAVLNEIEERGYTLKELQEDYTARLRFNIDFYLDWAEHYKYKGPKTFKSGKLF